MIFRLLKKSGEVVAIKMIDLEGVSLIHSFRSTKPSKQ